MFWNKREASAKDAVVESGVFGESRISSRNKYFWLETKPSNKSLPGLYLAENVLTRTSTLSGGSIYINIGSTNEPKFMRVMNCQTKYPLIFELFLTPAEHIQLRVQHDGEWTEFYFQTFTEALRFQDFLRAPDKDAPLVEQGLSPQISPTKNTESQKDPPLLGWDEFLSKKEFSDENLDRAVGRCFEEFLHLDLSESTQTPAISQISDWKLSVKWYNEVVRRLQIQATSTQLSVFKTSFAKSLKSFFQSVWNSNYEGLSFAECAAFHSSVQNIQQHSTVFSSTPNLSASISSLLQAILLSVEARFLANFAGGIKHLLQTLFAKDSFTISGPRVVANNALELVRLVTSLAQQMEGIDERALGELLRGVCAV